VVQGLDPARRRELSSTGLDAGWMLDSVLADLVADADRWRDGSNGGRDDVSPPSVAGDAPGGSGPAAIRPDDAGTAPMSLPAENPHLDGDFLGTRVRITPVSDAVLDELAAEAVGLLGRAAVPHNSIARAQTPRQRGAGLAGLAATLIVAGSWGRRARFRGASGRRAGGRRLMSRG
jgi:hypothetical protein